jgi:hypothetical protein
MVPVRRGVTVHPPLDAYLDSKRSPLLAFLSRGTAPLPTYIVGTVVGVYVRFRGINNRVAVTSVKEVEKGDGLKNGMSQPSSVGIYVMSVSQTSMTIIESKPSPSHLLM